MRLTRTVFPARPPRRRHPHRDLQPPPRRPPRAAIGEKAAATQNPAAAFEQADEILEKGFDKLILGFRATDFSAQYQTAREQVDPATRPTEEPTPTPPA